MENNIIKKFATEQALNECSLTDINIDNGIISLAQDITIYNNIEDSGLTERHLDSDISGSLPSKDSRHYLGDYSLKFTPGQYAEYAPGAGVDRLPEAGSMTVEFTFFYYETPDNYIYPFRFFRTGTNAEVYAMITSGNKLMFRVRGDNGGYNEITLGTDLVPSAEGTEYRCAIVINNPVGDTRDFDVYGNSSTPIGTASVVDAGGCIITLEEYRICDLEVWSPTTGELSIDEVRISEQAREVFEIEDYLNGNMAEGYGVVGDTWALYHCESPTRIIDNGYLPIGNILSPDIIKGGYIYPELLKFLILNKPANTNIELRYRKGDIIYGAWSAWTELTEIIFNDFELLSKFQIELQLTSTDINATPAVDWFGLFGSFSDGDELIISSLNLLETNLSDLVVSSGAKTKNRLYDNYLKPFWNIDTDWVDNSYEGDKHPEDDGWIKVTTDDTGEGTDGNIFSSGTSFERWTKAGVSPSVGQQIQFKVKRDASVATTERRGIGFSIKNENHRIELYLWNDKVSLDDGTGVVTHAIDTTIFHTYQIYIGGVGADELELRIDNEPDIKLSGSALSGSGNGWEFPINTYANLPDPTNIAIDFLRVGDYERWIETTETISGSPRTVENSVLVEFSESQEMSMLYLGNIINIDEFSIQYDDGGWQDLKVEILKSEFLDGFWFAKISEYINTTKIRLLIHTTDGIGQIGEFYAGDILYQPPDNPQNLEDKDEGKQGSYALGSGKVENWKEYESAYGSFRFNLIPEKHQKKFKEFYDLKKFIVLLEPQNRLDRFFKASWVSKWKAEYSVGLIQAGWDIDMVLKQTK
jgi:hypothetical protein